MQVGDSSPDVSPADLASMWEVTQSLLRKRTISAGHDISDGGIAVALAEMAFAGNTGIRVGPYSENVISLRKLAHYSFLTGGAAARAVKSCCGCMTFASIHLTLLSYQKCL